MPHRLTSVVERASTVELLFDLVFVFTITQVTEVVVERADWAGIAQAALTMAVIWWMYDAYVWLGNQTETSNVAPRLGFIGAMTAFLLLAVAIPDAFGDSGLLFGFAYLAVVIIHFALFALLGEAGSARSILRVIPANLGGAALLIVAGFVTGPLDWVLFAAALAVMISTSFTGAPTGFDLSASHFIERHGLLMIIAFGETIVTVGVGAAHHPIDASLIVGVVLCVAVVAAMWWCYFAGDDERADKNFTSTAKRRRGLLALSAFGLDHYAMIFGVVLFSAGVGLSFANVFAVAPTEAAWLLAAGVALYLLAAARYRQELTLGPAAARYLGAVVVLAFALVGVVLPVWWELLGILAALTAVIVIDSRRR
ncbi:low temperature requirement protein A [Subtercola lobariae]|uniref:Low temperature requirement protein A n=1 Tax=Subtercola lobariae TaxID=1588641 RepID=A0A917B9L9_9MICO|nr:low temperature requirement protein A [Subtercola lobariae]GGF33068.1 hypothetical protein GCM10011399_27710 [Subtercola lobariae]